MSVYTCTETILWVTDYCKVQVEPSGLINKINNVFGDLTGDKKFPLFSPWK